MTPSRPQHKSSTRRYFTTSTIGAVALSGLIAVPGAANTPPAAHPQPQTVKLPTSQTPMSGGGQNTSARSVSPSLPAAPRPTTVHTVAPGDTVSAIAQKYKTTVSAIAKTNNLSNVNFIRVGQRLTIASPISQGQGTTAAPSKPAPSKPATSTPAAQVTHVVKAGDTLWALAKKHNTTVAALSKLNKISSNGIIFVGQRLIISPGASFQQPTAPSKPATPAPSAPSNNAKPTITYTVKAGDTVSKIAAAHQVTSSAIAAANNLSNVNFIRIGQRLVIPGANTSTPPPSSSNNQGQLVGDTFLHYTYPQHVVAAANENKQALLASPIPSRSQMQQMVADTARKMGVDPALAQAIAFTESSFNHASVSPANAIGTMQVIPSSGDWASQLVGRPLNLLNPQDNVTAGVAIIRQLLRSMPNQDEAIASYYQGMGSVRKYGMFEDTKNYVAKVKSHMTRYQ